MKSLKTDGFKKIGTTKFKVYKTMFTVKQRSAWSGFTYDILDTRENVAGTLVWPDFPLAKNARLRSAVPGTWSTAIELNCEGANYVIAYEYLSRGWQNDIRFSLQLHDQLLVSVDCIQSTKLFARSSMSFTHPFNASLKRLKGFFSTAYELKSPTGSLGKIYEMGGLHLRRELVADLHQSISTPIQLFTIFLVLNHAYR